MEFLKEILGEELYNQFVLKLNAYNGDEANKDKQVKLANLSAGEYVSKGKYDSLSTQLSGKLTELQTANDLIAELKKGTKGDEGLQNKIKDYDAQVVALQQQLADTKLKAAIKVALLSEKAVDIDYLTYKLENKLKEDNKSLELDENDNIKDWKDVIEGLKTQFPNQFESAAAKTKVQPNVLPKSDDTEAQPSSLAEAIQQQYEMKG